MELTGLLPVLAWLQILPRLVLSDGNEGPGSSPDSSVPEETLRPILRLHPPGPRYLAGSSVTLTCSAPLQDGQLGFWFFHGTSSMRTLGTTPQASRSYQIPQLGLEHTGTYTCKYWVEQDGQESPSPESCPVSITVTGPLPSPTLSLGSQDPVYYQGEHVNLSCSAPRGEAVTGYRFYRGRGDQTPEQLPSPSGAAWLELRAETGNQGPYSCQYWRNEAGQEIPSAESNKVYITVQAPPTAPTLSLHPPHPLYLPGERVTLRCSAPGGARLQGYRFYGEQERLIHDEVPAPAGGAGLEIVAKMGKAGVYTCAYWILRSGRRILSERSQPVSLSVQAPPAAPTLSLSPPPPVYLPGESVMLTCSPPRGAPVAAGFQFSRDGGRKISSGSSDVHTLSITGPEDSGSYTCVYWIRPSGRKIQSPGSRPVSITVTAPPAAPRLSLDPPNTVYLPGERLNLSCSAPGAQEVTGYRFYKRPPGLSSEALPSPQGTWLEILAAVGDEGPYTCQYWSRESGRQLPSELSQPIAIRVTERPPAPRLALAPPHPVYVPGERVTLRCSAPRSEGVTRYRFYRQRGGLIADRVPEPTGGARLELRAETGMAGLYVCMYWTLRAGREVPSGESRPVSVSVTDFPRKPSVSLSPDYPAYVAGDSVEINCSAPPGASPVQYGLYESGEPLGSLTGDAGIWRMDLQANGTRNLTRSFSCTYMELIQERELPSYASDPVSVSVLPAPAAPSLRLIPPLPLYVTGETVTAECVVPTGPYVPRAHWVLRDGEALREPPGPQLPLNVTPSDSGTYRCGYSTELHGRHLRSPPSDLVSLSVTDPPPQPALSVDPPSGVVSEGLPLLITCMAPGDASERRFHFYKDGAELIPGDTGSEISTTEPSTGSMNFSVLSILRASPSNTGEFSCGYEVNMSGRWIPSRRSQALNVTVTDWSLPVPLVAGCSGAATALALLLLLICLCRKKKAATHRLSTSYWKSQELRRSRIMRRSTDISGVNMGLQQRTEGGWPQAVSQDWGLLPKLPAEGPRPGQAAGGAAPLKGQKEEDDADSGAEFEFPDIDPTYSQVTFSCSTFRQGQELSASHVYSTPDL